MLAHYFLLLLLVAIASFAQNLFDIHTAVKTKFGPVQGVHYPPRFSDRFAVRPEVIRKWPVAYLGIPYALPPVGDFRFQDPMPWNLTWTQAYGRRIYNAHRYGAQCKQSFAIQLGSQRENCLFLNVFTPPLERLRLLKKGTKKAKGLPVIFWIFGGAFMFGSGGAGSIYDSNPYSGSFVTSLKDVIIVSFNHRLAASGFLKTEQMQGNYGIMDQKLALKWTFENIAAFGGDPSNITIMGMSSGSYTGLMLAMDPTLPKVKRVISQSPPLGIKPKSIDDANAGGQLFLHDAGCLYASDQRRCLGRLPFKEIQTASKSSSQGWLSNVLTNPLKWLPVNDPDRYIANPLDMIKSNDTQVIDRIKSTEFLFGVAKNEAALFIGLVEGFGHVPGGALFVLRGNQTSKEYAKEFLRGEYTSSRNLLLFKLLGKTLTTFPERQYVHSLWHMFHGNETLVRQVLEHYPAKKIMSEVVAQLIDLFTDYMFICPVERMANSLSKLKAKTFMYELSYTPTYISAIVPKDGRLRGRTVLHAVDAPFFWNFFPEFSQQDKRYADLYSDYLAAFASGDINNHCIPNRISFSSNQHPFDLESQIPTQNSTAYCSSGMEPWAPYDSIAKRYMSFGEDGVYMKSGALRQEHCEFWNNIN